MVPRSRFLRCFNRGIAAQLRQITLQQYGNTYRELPSNYLCKGRKSMEHSYKHSRSKQRGASNLSYSMEQVAYDMMSTMIMILSYLWKWWHSCFPVYLSTSWPSRTCCPNPGWAWTPTSAPSQPNGQHGTGNQQQVQHVYIRRDRMWLF